MKRSALVLAVVSTGSVVLGLGCNGNGSVAAGLFKVYVSNTDSDTVSVLDGLTLVELAEIAVGNDPRGLSVSPDGLLVAVPNRFSDTVSVILTAADQVIATIALSASEPYNCVFSPDGTRIYVANKQGNVGGSVSVIDVGTMTEVDLVPLVGSGPEGIAVSPDGSQVYVVDRDSGEVEVIDTATDTVVASGIAAPSNPRDAAVTPDGAKLYVVGEGGLEILPTAGLVTATQTFPIITEASGRDVVVSPDGAFAYVARGPSNGSVAVVDTATDTVVAQIPLDTGAAYGIAVTDDGTQAFVSNDGSSVAAIDLGTRQQVNKTSDVGSAAKQLGVVGNPSTPAGVNEWWLPWILPEFRSVRFPG